MRQACFLAAVLAAVLATAGCATQGDTPDLGPPSASAEPPPPASLADIPASPAGYKLTPAEEKLDCAKLTGQMKVRIANMRAAFASRAGSEAGRVAQSVATPVLGGPQRGADPTADLGADRAKLEAFNRRLSDKKCKTLDINAELSSQGAAPPARTPPKAPAQPAKSG